MTSDPALPAKHGSNSPVLDARLADALAKHGAGNNDAAATIYRAILAEQPQHPDALHLLGVIAQQKGNAALALKLIEAALAYNANHAAAWANRALVLQALGRLNDALQSAKMAIDSDPALATARDCAATLSRKLKNYDEALRYHQQALTLQPEDVTFKANYAATLLTTGAIQAAYQQLHYMSKARLDNLHIADVPAVLGSILQAAGYPDRAIPYFRRAAELAPHMPGIGVNEALARLKIGDYERGLALWQTRVDSKAELLQAIPKWEGNPVDHLLLYEDQGMGDTIQGLRYLPALRALANKVTLQVPRPLYELAINNFPEITVVAPGELSSNIDARAALISLPFYFETRLTSILSNIPYLYADAKRQQVWQAHLAPATKPYIGLVWGGNPDFPNDKNRSVPFAQLQPLLASAAKHLISLQLGRPADQEAVIASGMLDLAPRLNSFADTAAALMHIDVLVTVDTAIAHLAGALGRPVWLMLPFDPDWRWMLEREDSPWYPTIKIFRQTQPGDWTGVLHKIADDMQKFLQGNYNILSSVMWPGAVAQRNKHALSLLE